MSARVLYISNARLPTEKAHGYAIAKICSALAGIGARVELWHPRQSRRHPLREATVFDYYGVPPGFGVRYLPTLAIERAKRLLPGRSFMAVSLTRGIIRSLIAAMRARRARPDLCWTRDPTMMVCLVALGLPTLLEVHSVPARARRRFISWAARRASLAGVLTLTEALCRDVIELGVPPERVAVFPNAVDVGLFTDGPDRAHVRSALNLPQENQIVGYIGRFRTSRGVEKGLADLIEAIGGMSSDVRPLLLCVGGPDDSIPVYEALARERGLGEADIRLEGHVPPTEVPAWVRACDVCVIPWWDKPQTDSPAPPLKLFEYMAAGVPIVVGDFDEVDQVIDNGRNGLVVPRKDTRAIAEAVGTLLADGSLRERVARAAHEDSQRYSWAERARSGLRIALGTR